MNFKNLKKAETKLKPTNLDKENLFGMAIQKGPASMRKSNTMKARITNFGDEPQVGSDDELNNCQ